MFYDMTQDRNQPARFYLTGDALERINQAIALTRQQLIAGQASLDGRHLTDALVEAEEALGGVARDLRRAVDADIDEAEASGETARQRDAWYPTYRAA